MTKLIWVRPALVSKWPIPYRTLRLTIQTPLESLTEMLYMIKKKRKKEKTEIDLFIALDNRN